MLKGKSISFEGGEGSGKSTIIKLLVEYLNSNTDLDIIQTREPGGSKIAEQIREVILDKSNTEMSYETEALLYAAARAQLLEEKIKPLLHSGKTIIFDRYIDSSFVYQGGCRGLGIDRILEMNKFALDYMPIRTFLLDIDPKIGLSRIHNNDRETNRLDDENMDFHYNIRKFYLELANKFPDRIIIIDANRTPDLILGDILKNLKDLI